MLIIKFEETSLRQDIDEVFEERFPGIKYEKHLIANKRFKIIEFHFYTNNFDLEQLRCFDYDASYIGFRYETKCNECEKEINFKRLICGHCNKKENI